MHDDPNVVIAAILEGRTVRWTVDYMWDGDMIMSNWSTFVDGPEFGCRWLGSTGTLVVPVYEDAAWLDSTPMEVARGLHRRWRELQRTRS